MKAVVLAAGEGKRLQPLTSTRSKHMIPIAGKPILEYILLAIKENGIKDVLIITNYYEDRIKQYFSDGSEWDLKIDYVHQEELLGTAHAIGLAEEYVGNEAFLIIYGDLFIDASVIRSAIRKHNEKGLAILCTVTLDDPQQYGIVFVEGDRVVGVLEKPGFKESGSQVNTGVYVFTKNVFEQIRETGTSPRDEIEITDTIQEMIKKEIGVATTRIRCEDWIDVGRPWDLLEVNRRVLQRSSLEIKGDVEDGVRIKGAVHLEENSRLLSGTYIEGPVYIGSGCEIGPNCYIRPFTSLGRNVRIGNGCEVKNSVILNGSHIGHLSYIGDSIIGENCNFGAGTITANLRLDKKSVRVRIKGEVVDSGKRKLGVIMGDNVEIGIGVRFMPGVKIGVGSWIGPSITVYKNVHSGTVLTQKQGLTLRKRSIS